MPSTIYQNAYPLQLNSRNNCVPQLPANESAAKSRLAQIPWSWILRPVGIFCLVFCGYAGMAGSVPQAQPVGDSIQAVEQYLNRLAQERHFSGGLLIVRDGRQEFCKAYGWANKDKKIPFMVSTLAPLGNITRSFTSAAVLKLEQQGKITVHDPLQRFFPEVPADKAQITIHQLLTHSSGFPEHLHNSGGEFARLESETFLQRAFSEPLVFAPGEKGESSNVDMSLLALIVEKVSGTDYESFLQHDVLEPLGIHDIGYFANRAPDDGLAHGYLNGQDWGTMQRHFLDSGGGPFWNLKGNSGLQASLQDMFLWANAFTEKTVLPDSSIRRMFTSQVPDAGTGGESSFGYGCSIRETDQHTELIDNEGTNGVYFARLIRMPREGLVFYMITNESTVNSFRVLPNITQLYLQGHISQDAMTDPPKFESPVAEQIYEILNRPKTRDLRKELEKSNLKVDNHMLLLQVGRTLIQEKKVDQAVLLYRYYTKTFPEVVVAWNDLGDLYQMKDDAQEAIKCYRQALVLHPDNTRARDNLARLNPFIGN